MQLRQHQQQRLKRNNVTVLLTNNLYPSELSGGFYFNLLQNASLSIMIRIFVAAILILPYFHSGRVNTAIKMIKYLFLLLLTCSLTTLNAQSNNNYTQGKTHSERPPFDSLNNGSGINFGKLNNLQVYNLSKLGMVWGFLKYYHPAVTSGSINIDAEVFKVIPKLLATDVEYVADKTIETWVDGFGVPPACEKCGAAVLDNSTKMMPDYGVLFIPDNFIKRFMDKLDFIKNNRAEGSLHYYAEIDSIKGIPVFTNEIPYNNTGYPDAGLRLLALYRYWNMVQYFYPYKYAIGTDWNEVLREFIPSFIYARDSEEYESACLSLVCRLNDTHANLWGVPKLDHLKGELMTPLQAKFIDEQLVITDYYNDPDLFKTVFKKGSIIERINEFPIKDLLKKYSPLTPSSSYTTNRRDLPGPYGYLLRGNELNVQISVRENKDTKDVTMVREKWNENMSGAANKLPGYKIMKDNIGYIYPGYLKVADLGKIKIQFAKTKGIIIDLRCTPSINMIPEYINWLKNSPSSFSRLIKGNANIPGYFTITDGPLVGEKSKENYKGKIVVIVNDYTQDNAEYTALALSSIPNAIVLGSTTAGTMGDVSKITLPGGIVTTFTGIGILGANSTDIHHIGLKINKEVKQTIKGISEDKDELLEEAIKLIQK